MSSRLSILLAVITTCLLSAGAGPLRAQASGGVAATQGAQDLRLRPGDVLQIRVWPNETLGGEFQIEDTGEVYLPLLGEVRAADVPLGDLRQELRDRYGEAMQNPVVSITPVFSVGIIGAVRAPGIYPVTPSQGFFDVIGQAGGFSANANEDEVRIVREGEVVEFDALRALEEGRGLVSATILPGDQIVVPGGTDWTFRDVLSILQTVVTIGLLADRIVN